MAYEHLYQFYDVLMEDVPYDQYIGLVKKYAKVNDYILDVGCGTGSVLVSLLDSGFKVDGLDLSEDMLLVTQNKLTEKNLKSLLFQDDMRDIEIEDTYDIIISYLDAINYLTSKNDVKKTFQNIYNALKKDGLFIFDVHSFKTVHEVFDGYSFNEMGEDFSYLWNAFVEKETTCTHIYHELSFFIKQINELYERYDENHHQVVFPLEIYIQYLEEIGFKIEEIQYDFDTSKNEANAHKIIIVTKKCLL